MRRTVFKKSALSSLRLVLAPVLFTLAALLLIVIGLRRTEASGRAEGLRILEEGLRRATIQCYVVEGSYPESLAYIEERYGVHIDRARYIVHYEVLASNILPLITVIERG